MKFYIIHLARATARRSNVDRLIDTLPGEVEVLDAVDAQTLDPSEMARYVPRNGLFPPYPFALRPAEIACFLSHRKAWSQIAEADAPGAMIIEDDVLINRAQFDPALALVEENCTAGDAVRFSMKDREKPAQVTADQGGVRLFTPKLPGLGMQAQFIGREAAKRLLAATEQFDRPVDTTLQMWWHVGVRPLSVYPCGVTEISGSTGGSLIGRPDQGPGAKLLREVKRPLYRMGLWARSKSL